MASININKQTNKKQGDKKPKGGLGMKKTVLGIMVTIITLALTACPSPPPPAPAGDFSLAANAVTITKGNSGTVTVTVNRTNGFSDLVDLVLSGEPTGVTGSFNPTSADASSDLTINVTNAATPGSYTLTVTGTADGKTRTAVFSLNVTALADTTKPKILSVSPSNNKSGVVNNTNIVIKFSEPMNKASGQAAYQSSTSGIKPSEVSFSWNATGTQLTIKPNSKLKYRSVAYPLLLPAYQYIFSISNTATDLVGNPLENPQTVKFRTLRRVKHTLYSVIDDDIRADGKIHVCTTQSIMCVGDSGIASNAQYKAYIGFSLAALPSDLKTIEKAVVYMYQKSTYGNPYTDLTSAFNKLLIQHVYFGPTLSFADFNTPVLRNEGNLSTSKTPGYKGNDVTISVKDDYTKRAIRGNRSQFMLSFFKASDFDNFADTASFYTRETTGTTKDPKMTIYYLKP